MAAVSIDWSRQAFDLVIEEPDNGQARERLLDLYGELDESDRQLLGWSRKILEQTIAQLLTPWYRFFLAYDPAPVLRQVRCPVLAINGSLDVQVTATQNLAGIESALRDGGNEDFTITLLPDLNHFFQTTTTGALSECIEIPETFAPVALDAVSDWVRQRTDLDPITAVLGSFSSASPRQPVLSPNYPNPFNSGTVISYTLAAPGPVDLAIYNARGQRLTTLVQSTVAACSHSLVWNGKDAAGTELASGVYLYRLRAGSREVSRKLLLVR